MTVDRSPVEPITNICTLTLMLLSLQMLYEFYYTLHFVKTCEVFWLILITVLKIGILCITLAWSSFLSITNFIQALLFLSIFNNCWLIYFSRGGKLKILATVPLFQDAHSFRFVNNELFKLLNKSLSCIISQGIEILSLQTFDMLSQYSLILRQQPLIALQIQNFH